MLFQTICLNVGDDTDEVLGDSVVLLYHSLEEGLLTLDKLFVVCFHDVVEHILATYEFVYWRIVVHESGVASEFPNDMAVPVFNPFEVKMFRKFWNIHLDNFINEVSSAGCNTFIIHARKAWLKGLSPKDNREIPPLNYERVYKLKNAFPDLQFIINGGIKSLHESSIHLQHVDGVMIGREAYENPLLLAEVDSVIFSDKKVSTSRSDILKSLIPYIGDELERGTKISHITRHLMGLFRGFDGAKNMRKYLISLNNAMNPIENFEFLLKEETI